MSESIKIGQDSICVSCENTPAQGQCVQCFICNGMFHAICENVGSDSLLASKTMVKTFLAVSTKSNFKFFCDKCLTDFEINKEATENQKINSLERKVGNMENKLEEIFTLLKRNQNNQGGRVNTNSVLKSTSIWHDKEKLAAVKAPPSKSVLVVKNTNDTEKDNTNYSKVESVIMDNNLAVSQSYKNRSGDLVVICDTESSRNQLKDLVSSTNDDIIMNAPSEKRSSITIVGLPKEYNKDELINMLVMQNGYIKQFSNSNDINEHIQIFSVRPLKNNPQKFQVFASVSTTLREGFRHFKDKVTLGLSSCKVYDRYHVKRCNNCQGFGHYVIDCPTPLIHTCGSCSGSHMTKDCVYDIPKCINCVKSNIEDTGHHTNSFKCPSLIKQQDRLKENQNRSNLNLQKNNILPYR